MPVDVSEEDLSSFFDAALSLTRSGGDLVRAAINERDKRVETKDSKVDLVTETDRAVEKLLFDGLTWDGWKNWSKCKAMWNQNMDKLC